MAFGWQQIQTSENGPYRKDVQIGNTIWLDLSKKHTYICFNNAGKWRKTFSKMRRKICAVNCNFLAIQDL
jgi:hypothetical protein